MALFLACVDYRQPVSPELLPEGAKISAPPNQRLFMALLNLPPPKKMHKSISKAQPIRWSISHLIHSQESSTALIASAEGMVENRVILRNITATLEALGSCLPVMHVCICAHCIAFVGI